MNSNRFSELLNLYVDDKTTGEEREELMQLIHEGSHDETIRESIHAMLLNGPVREDMDPQKARKMLKGILATADEQDKIIPMRPAAGNWRWVAAAAVLVLAVSAGSWFSRREPAPRQLITLQEKNRNLLSLRENNLCDFRMEVPCC